MPKECRFEGCEKKVRALGLCSGHYGQQNRGKPLTPLRRRQRRLSKECIFESCDIVPRTMGLCSGHYSQHIRGKPLTPLIRRHNKFLFEYKLKICSKCLETKGVEEFYRKAANMKASLASSCKQCQAIYTRQYRFGLSPEQFDEILIKQGGKCPVCTLPLTEDDQVIDHSHVTGQIRGILHSNCNALLGMANDHPEILYNAAKYLENNF